jgi:hypothetical protein
MADASKYRIEKFSHRRIKPWQEGGTEIAPVMLLPLDSEGAVAHLDELVRS